VSSRRPRKLALLADYHEEDWPSMDLVVDMLHAGLSRRSDPLGPAEIIRPRMPNWFGRSGGVVPAGVALNANRLAGRFWHYPRHLSRETERFAAFHVADHSYAHLVHHLPADVTGVYCHDIDVFRSLVTPLAAPRPLWFRAMARHVLRGLQRAAVVFFSTSGVRRALLAHGMVDERRLVWAPYGVAPEFLESDHGTAAAAYLERLGGKPFLLHVGSCIARKRVDVLLSVFAQLSREYPELRLVQVGGQFTAAHRAQIEQAGLAAAILQVKGLTRQALAGLYRAAELVLVPSEAEGFGLPVIEALACGAKVLASDIEPLREVGAAAVSYCPVADLAAWLSVARSSLETVDPPSARAARLAHANRYTWDAHADVIGSAYTRLMGN
jgi:glycosyltransferase involved in cell wall biosynthesis